MKTNARIPVHKRIHVEEVGRDYSGEASPYWDYVIQTHDNLFDSFHVLEDPYANPDVLSGEEAIYNRPLTAVGKLQLQAVQETYTSLSPRQREAILLLYAGVWTIWKDSRGNKHEERLYTLQAVANELGISHQAVSLLLSSIKTKIRRRYEKLKAIENGGCGNADSGPYTAPATENGGRK